VWDILIKRGLTKSKLHASFGQHLLKLVVELKLCKGELKTTLRRLHEHKLSLDKELHTYKEAAAKAQERVQKAQATKAITLKAHRQNATLSVARQEKQAQRLIKVEEDVKQAEQEHHFAQLNLSSVHRKHEICRGRLLEQFENKERLLGMRLTRVVQLCAMVRPSDETFNHPFLSGDDLFCFLVVCWVGRDI